MRCALINTATSTVENIILADPEKDPAPEGYSLLAADDAVTIGWLWQNGVFADPNPPPPPPPVAVPEVVSSRQALLLLLNQGLLDQVEAMIASQDKATQITWNRATEFKRDDPLLNQLAANLTPPLTSEQLDQFFIAASAL